MRSEALKHRSARRMLFAQINQGAAGWMQTTAGSWYVLTEAGSTTTLSLFVIASMTPSLLLNPVGGRLMQSYSPVAMVKVLAPLAALAPLLIAGLYAAGTLSIPLLFVLTVVGASCRALQAPTFAKILPLTVPERQRAAVLGYSAIAFNVSRSVGPVIAGIAGTGLAYLLSGIGFLIVAAIMFVTPLDSAQSAPTTTQPGAFTVDPKGLLSARSTDVEHHDRSHLVLVRGRLLSGVRVDPSPSRPSPKTPAPRLCPGRPLRMCGDRRHSRIDPCCATRQQRQPHLSHRSSSSQQP